MHILKKLEREIFTIFFMPQPQWSLLGRSKTETQKFHFDLLLWMAGAETLSFPVSLAGSQSRSKPLRTTTSVGDKIPTSQFSSLVHRIQCQSLLSAIFDGLRYHLQSVGLYIPPDQLNIKNLASAS